MLGEELLHPLVPQVLQEVQHLSVLVVQIHLQQPVLGEVDPLGLEQVVLDPKTLTPHRGKAF